jgi:glycogen synthase
MNIAILTNEYPPHIYGGAGVHVEYLTRELAALEERKHSVQVLCFGDQKESSGNLTVEGIQPDSRFPLQELQHPKLMDTLLRNLIMSGKLAQADLVHCHTWYTHFAGCLLRSLLGVPLVLSTHSLEPHRPWKAEQLGAAYQVSSWVEKTAYENADGVIAVSQSMKADVNRLYGVPFEKIRVIYNGIDTSQYKPTPNPSVLTAHKIDPQKPFILFVGRITRQKGIIHLVNAIKHIRPGMQIVLCAGAPDTKEIGVEMAEKVEEAKKQTKNDVIWVSEMVTREDVITLYTHATLFVCPSIYEPFGIINLEAMACGTPVVASAIGGIPEVVEHNRTGLLVPLEPKSALELDPIDPTKFSRDLAAAVNSLLEAPEKMKEMAARARERVEKHFSWTSIARQTLEFYRELIENSGRRPR